MGFVADALWQIKLGDYKSAASLLGSHLDEPSLKPSARVSLMEWMADCYSKCQEHSEAAKWFESAGKTMLDCPGVPQTERKRRAAVFFERALDSHKADNNIQGIRRLAALKYSLAPSS